MTERRARVLAGSVGLAEGPVFLRRGGILVVSVDRGHIIRIAEDGVSIFAVTGTGPNGLTEAVDGTIYVAMCGRAGRRPRDGTPSGILAVRPHGKLQWITQEPVAPNDLCFGPDGLLYFTDPTRPQRDDGRIWRIDVRTGESELLVSVPWYPNGIGFGRETDMLFVADTRGARIMRFPLDQSGLGVPEPCVRLVHGVPDGFAFTKGGDMVVATQGPGSAPGDIQTYSPDGALLDVYQPGVGRAFTNVALSSEAQLVITSAGETAAIATGGEPGGMVLLVEGWPSVGLPLHPFR